MGTTSLRSSKSPSVFRPFRVVEPQGPVAAADGGTPIPGTSTEKRLGLGFTGASLSDEAAARSAREPPVPGELGGVVRCCAVTSDANDEVRSRKELAEG